MARGDHNGGVQDHDGLLVIEASSEGSTALLTLKGEMDISNAHTLHSHLTRVVGGGSTTVDIDMSAVTFMDSTGLGGLLEVRRLGAALVIRNPSAQVKRILDLVSIEGVDGVEVVPAT